MKLFLIGLIVSSTALADCRLVIDQHSDIFTAPVKTPASRVINALAKAGYQAKSYSEAIDSGWDINSTPYLKLGCFRDAFSFGCNVTLEKYPSLEDLRNGTHRQLINRHHVPFTNPSFKRESKIFSRAIKKHMPECLD